MKSAFLVILALVVSSFANAQSLNLDSDNRRGDTYRRGDGMTEGSATACKVVQTRTVTMEVSNNAKVAGATLGGLFGVAAIQNSNPNNTPLATLGALFGAIGGNAVAEKVFADAATEIVVNCNGQAIVVVQQKDDTQVPTRGTEVFVIRNQGRTRIVPL